MLAMTLPRALLASFFIGVGALAMQACGGASSASEPKNVDPKGPAPEPVAAAASPTAPATTVAPSAGNAPEISRSVGVAGGVVLLWPRIPGLAKDPDSRQIAARIQKRLATIVQRALPGWPIDVRPEPERVCPRSGCTALAVGAVLSRSGNGCAITATVSATGASPARLIPWVGNMQLRNQMAPFRQPPEQEISVSDYQSCAAVDGDLATHEADVESGIRSVAGK
jgi:hypothetical protein